MCLSVDLGVPGGDSAAWCLLLRDADGSITVLARGTGPAPRDPEQRLERVRRAAAANRALILREVGHGEFTVSWSA